MGICSTMTIETRADIVFVGLVDDAGIKNGVRGMEISIGDQVGSVRIAAKNVSFTLIASAIHAMSERDATPIESSLRTGPSQGCREYRP
jgi:hypothetical protein